MGKEFIAKRKRFKQKSLNFCKREKRLIINKRLIVFYPRLKLKINEIREIRPQKAKIIIKQSNIIQIVQDQINKCINRMETEHLHTQNQNLKEFKKALDDCQSALKIDPKYVKAYHRKSKALIGLKNKIDAYTALQQALKIQPDNSECLSDLKDLREQMNEQQKNKLEGQSKFKKIAIQQDSQEQQQIQQKK